MSYVFDAERDIAGPGSYAWAAASSAPAATHLWNMLRLQRYPARRRSLSLAVEGLDQRALLGAGFSHALLARAAQRPLIS